MKAPIRSPRGEHPPARQGDVWKPKRLDPQKFPDKPQGNNIPPTTIENIRYLLDTHGVTVRYNVIKKKLEIYLPGIATTDDNADNVKMSYLTSLAKLNGLSTGYVPEFVAVLADQDSYNPVAEWIERVPWDRKDRLPAYYNTLQTEPDFPIELKQTLMRKWLLSCVAAALKTHGFKCRGVLTLQGAQGLGKTSWGKSLINDPLLADSVIKTDHHLDSGNKDSLLTAVSHFIVEIGELDSSFKRDIARLKGFLTAEHDKVRRPYARTDSEYPRRTVFYATVNQGDFLVDNTGNSRWWTLPVIEIDHRHAIDMQQLFAQLAVEFRDGAEWWLSPDEERALAAQNEKHRHYSLVEDRLREVVDFEADIDAEREAMTASDILRMAGIANPTNAQAKECGGILRQAFGNPKRIHGRDKWRVPLREGSQGEATNPHQPDRPKKKSQTFD